MWQRIAREAWPAWAATLETVWQHKDGHWLTGSTNRGSTLWELRVPGGAVYTNQLDLPFKEDLGAPLNWATNELLEEYPHRERTTA